MKGSVGGQNLRKLSIFSGLNENEINKLSGIVVRRTLVAGELLYLENEFPKFFYVLIKGRIKAVANSSSGKEIIMGFFSAGEILGPTSILRDRPTNVSMEAVTPCDVLGFRKAEFLSFILNHSTVSHEVIKTMAARISELARRLRDMAGEKVEQRIARILLMLFSRLGPTLPFTRKEIAEMVGTTTETVIRTMRQFKNKGIINSLRGKLIILDAAQLRICMEKE